LHILHMQELIFSFAIFLTKKRHCQIKHQKVKHPAMYNIIHYQISTPL